MKGLFFIGDVRRFLFLENPTKKGFNFFKGRWNSFVRDITAKFEGTFLIRSEE